MPKSTLTAYKHNPGIMMVVSFLLITIVNAVVIFTANMFFPQQVVLGTMSLNHGWAIALSASALSLVTIFALPFVNEAESYVKRPWSPMEMMGIYFVVNLVAVWLVTRASDIFGLGVRSWVVVVVLAIALDMLQGLVMMMLEKKRTED